MDDIVVFGFELHIGNDLHAKVDKAVQVVFCASAPTLGEMTRTVKC